MVCMIAYKFFTYTINQEGLNTCTKMCTVDFLAKSEISSSIIRIVVKLVQEMNKMVLIYTLVFLSVNLDLTKAE